MSPVRTRRKNRSSRSSTFCTTPKSTPPSAQRSPRARCSSALPVPVKRCWPRPLRVKRRCRFSRSPALTLSRCSSASARAACATSSPRRRRSPPASSSSTRSTPSANPATAAATAAATTSASRHSTSCSPKWTALTRARASSCLPRRTARRCSTRRCCAPAASTAASPSTARTSPAA